MPSTKLLCLTVTGSWCETQSVQCIHWTITFPSGTCRRQVCLNWTRLQHIAIFLVIRHRL